jgi:cobalamin biosynthesis protein CobW
MRGVAVDILTGFLGSGKTTLLRHALAHGLDQQRVAVIMNEIGDIGIDGRVITGLAHVERMIELTSGCICCSIDDYRFDLALQEILDTAQPHAVIIESTGLADPVALADRVSAAGLGIDAIITVVDAHEIESQMDTVEVATTQVTAADFVIVNKCDLLTADTLARVTACIRAANPRAEMMTTAHGKVDPDVLFATGVARHRARVRNGAGHLARDGFGSFAYHTTAQLSPMPFAALLDRLPREVVRAKGLVHFDGDQQPYLFNFTCGRYDLRPLPGPPVDGSQLVFIGRQLGRVEPLLRDALRACEGAVVEHHRHV